MNSQLTPEAQAAMDEPLMTPKEVATVFRVDPKTVTRWARDGKLSAIRTLGGHRRYREAEVMKLWGEDPETFYQRLAQQRAS